MKAGHRSLRTVAAVVLGIAVAGGLVVALLLVLRTFKGGCSVGRICATVNATADAGPAEQRAQGFLHGIGNSLRGHPEAPIPTLMDGLKPRWWRIQLNHNLADDWYAASRGTTVTAILSDAWKEAHTDSSGRTQTPWSDWNAYRSWVGDFVKVAEALGGRVDYWDVQNEPGGPNYYSTQDQPSITVANLLQQFLVAYQAIKSANPRAKVVGPSLDSYRDYPGEYGRNLVDLRTFLDFCVQHGLRPDAVSWHETGAGTGPSGSGGGPADIPNHVAAARALLRARPALGQPAIFINEFGADTTHLVPGWAVAEITALEAANVDEANLSCWGLPPGQGNECFRPDLDGLLTPDGTQPHAVYWVFASYAIMSGQRVPVTASSGAVSGFATRQPSNGAIKVLLGRHVSCTARTNRYCNQRGLAPAPASYVSVTIKVSTTSPVSVAVARVPNVAGALAFPRAGKPNVMDPKSGQITVDLPTVGDGDAYFIDIEPVNSNG